MWHMVYASKIKMQLPWNQMIVYDGISIFDCYNMLILPRGVTLLALAWLNPETTTSISVLCYEQL